MQSQRNWKELVERMTMTKACYNATRRRVLSRARKGWKEHSNWAPSLLLERKNTDIYRVKVITKCDEQYEHSYACEHMSRAHV